MIELIIGALIGLVLGLTGAGGSLLAVPLLIYGLHLPPTQASGLALGAVAIAAIIGVAGRLQSKTILWQPGLVFALGGALFTPAGQWLAKQLSETVLLSSFALLTLFIAARLWQQAARDPAATAIIRADASNQVDNNREPACRFSANGQFEWRLPCILRLMVAGISAGVLSGLFGVGGGFLIVPLLVFLTQVSMAQAVATSLLVISLISGSGFISSLFMNSIVINSIGSTGYSGNLLLLIGSGAALGMLGGTLIGKKIAGPVLQKGFALLMLCTAIGMISQQIFYG
jgi:uncharacterized membrane protein YfcA